jgi:hypothetical protein
MINALAEIRACVLTVRTARADARVHSPTLSEMRNSIRFYVWKRLTDNPIFVSLFYLNLLHPFIRNRAIDLGIRVPAIDRAGRKTADADPLPRSE